MYEFYVVLISLFCIAAGVVMAIGGSMPIRDDWSDMIGRIVAWIIAVCLICGGVGMIRTLGVI